MPTIATSQDAWLAARKDLLAREKAFTRERDALSAARRELPWLRVEKAYTFDTTEGPASLRDLFGPHSQLLIKHFMFGEGWEEGCPSCSFWADGLDGLDVHLAHRDIAFVVVSSAPLETLQAYRARMGWRFRWVSCAGSDFNLDMNVSFTQEMLNSGEAVYNYAPKGFPSTEAPGVTAWVHEDETVYHTYGTFGRGLDALNSAYQLMDLTAKGRDELGLPWPMAWLRRRDQYGDAG